MREVARTPGQVTPGARGGETLPCKTVRGLFSLFRVFPSSPPKAKVSRGVEASLDEAREVAAIPPIRLTSQPQVRCRRC